MAKIFAVSNQKGGVGKTTSSVNIASVCAMSGIKTLLIDLDPQGNASSGLGIDRSNLKSSIYDCIIGNSKIEDCVVASNIDNLSVLPANSDLAASEIELIGMEEREFLLKKLLQTVEENFDQILIDCPPSLGLLTINSLTASQYLIIPLQCEYYALEGLGQLLNTFQLVQSKLNQSLEIGGVILTMADFRTNLTQQVIEEVQKFFGEKVFKTIIPRSVKISEAPSFGKPVTIYDPSSRGAKSYTALAAEFIERFEFKKEEPRPVETIETANLSTENVEAKES